MEVVVFVPKTLDEVILGLFKPLMHRIVQNESFFLIKYVGFFSTYDAVQEAVSHYSDRVSQSLTAISI